VSRSYAVKPRRESELSYCILAIYEGKGEPSLVLRPAYPQPGPATEEVAERHRLERRKSPSGAVETPLARIRRAMIMTNGSRENSGNSPE